MHSAAQIPDVEGSPTTGGQEVLGRGRLAAASLLQASGLSHERRGPPSGLLLQFLA